ncbi:VOC family protein [Candidatus Woesearchaeota archaeon]|nr:VOC family protein [Candidatus Woesearchaeota archaeon]
MEKDELKIIGHHTAITVSDLDRSMSWYQKLGFKPSKLFERKEMGAKIALMYLNNGYGLELFSFKEFNPLPEYRKTLIGDLRTIGTKHLALGVEDIVVACEELRKKGIAIGQEPSVGGSGHRYVFLNDPDGVLVELFEKTEYLGGK